MKVYRSTMEKQMDEMENAEVITNPGERVSTFWRKMGYRWELVKDFLRHPLSRRRRGESDT